MRVGIGYDIHRLVPDRPLVIGGVVIPFPLGLEGHSDADVLLHAVADALLGAVGEGDIGRHFPPDDPRYRRVPSTDLLRTVASLLARQGYVPANVDATVVAEAPPLAPHIPQMRQVIAAILALDPQAVSVKATTHERVGGLGRGEAIAAVAVVLVERRRPEAAAQAAAPGGVAAPEGRSGQGTPAGGSGA